MSFELKRKHVSIFPHKDKDGNWVNYIEDLELPAPSVFTMVIRMFERLNVTKVRMPGRVLYMLAKRYEDELASKKD